MSLKVIETTAIRKLGCGFVFAFYYSKYGAILYCLRDTLTLLVENRKLFIPACISRPRKG